MDDSESFLNNSFIWGLLFLTVVGIIEILLEGSPNAKSPPTPGPTPAVTATPAPRRDAGDFSAGLFRELAALQNNARLKP